MYRIGIVGHGPEYISDKNSFLRIVDRVIDLISYQYGEDLIVNVGGNIGTAHDVIEVCLDRKIKYHLFLPCPPDNLSVEWYKNQQVALENYFRHAWANTIYSSDYKIESEKRTYECIIDTSDFVICFWNGMKQGDVFSSIKYALKQNKIIINGLNDLKLVTNEDM